MRTKLILVLGALAVFGVICVLPVGGQAQSHPTQRATPPDLGMYPSEPPSRPLNLLFVHHSVGGQLLADKGSETSLSESIHVTHPNGGGLRKLLQTNQYRVHEASYGSAVGDKTDIFDWLPKFQNEYDRLIRTKMNDERLGDAERNDIVVLKSCYPNNRFVSEGTPPGSATGPELTIWNARAALLALRDELAKHPDVLFVYFTAPPNAPGYRPEAIYKQLARKALGKPSTAQTLAERARLAREFNTWVASKDGWLKDYPLQNVAVFDYYGLLTGENSNLSKYPSGNGSDSHPSADGQATAAKEFVPFLNRAVRRSRLFE